MAKAWYKAAWSVADNAMRTWSERLQKVVRLLRLARALLVVGILLVLASAVVGLAWPQYFAYAYAVAVLVLVVPLVMLVFLVGLPLRARSVVRLIDMGYPANARELAIRVLARKLHDESIASEELLWDTAVNEGRKWMRKMEEERGKRNGPDGPDPQP
jgi:hypothetical protein